MPQNPIVKDIDILGGEPVFRGTRVPFKIMIEYLEGGDTLDAFSGVTGTSSTRVMPLRAINRFNGTSPGMMTSAPVSLITRRAASRNCSMTGPGLA